MTIPSPAPFVRAVAYAAAFALVMLASATVSVVRWVVLPLSLCAFGILSLADWERAKLVVAVLKPYAAEQKALARRGTEAFVRALFPNLPSREIGG